jgi:nucleoporin POM152
MYYEVKQIGDVSYPLAQHKDAVIPRSQRLLFEQQVSKRPVAQFKNRNRVAYCLGDAFAPRDSATADGQIILEGAPPFKVGLSIKNYASSQVEFVDVEVLDLAWNVNLPDYKFNSIGPHLVAIESIQDASNCAPATLDPLSSSFWVDVSETAAISPLDRRMDYCAGDVSQFQLEGTPPWSIGYGYLLLYRPR